MLEELNTLPCPACGEAASLVHNRKQFWVTCLDVEGMKKGCFLTTGKHATQDAAVTAWNSLPRALTWTTEPPKVCGEYWCEWTNSDGTITTDVIHVRPNMFNWRKQDNRRWAGPIPAPLEPQNG